MSARRPINGVSCVGRLWRAVVSDRTGSTSATDVPVLRCQTCSGRPRSCRPWSPRSTSAVPAGRRCCTSTAVLPDTRICPRRAIARSARPRSSVGPASPTGSTTTPVCTAERTVSNPPARCPASAASMAAAGSSNEAMTTRSPKSSAGSDVPPPSVIARSWRCRCFGAIDRRKQERARGGLQTERTGLGLDHDCLQERSPSARMAQSSSATDHSLTKLGGIPASRCRRSRPDRVVAQIPPRFGSPRLRS